MFELSEEQQLIVNAAAGFTDDRLRPHAEHWDQNRILDREVLEDLCALGFGGIYTGEQEGGSGLGRLEAAMIFEQLSKGCIGHATFLTIHNMAAWMVDRFGSDALRPDCTLLLEVDTERLTRRLAARDGDTSDVPEPDGR